MHDACGMRLGETLGNLVGDAGSASWRQLAARQQVAQAPARYPFHDDERDAGLMANVMDGQDVGMVQGGSRLSLLLETTQTVRIVGEIG